MNGQLQFSDLLKQQETLNNIERISKESLDVQWGIWEQLDADNRKLLSNSFGEMQTKFLSSLKEIVNNSSLLTPREEKLDASAAAESRDENIQMQNEQLDLLKKIEENTRAPMQDTGGKEDKVKPKGFIDSLFDSMITGITIAWATMMKPGALLKTLTKTLGKLTFIGAIVGGLVNGMIDAFDSWTQTGSFTEAIIAGLGGMLEFLSFGLFDAESLRSLLDNVDMLYEEYIVQPIEQFVSTITEVFDNVKTFFVDAVDSFSSMIRSIGVPEIKFTIPLIDKEVTIGPYYPFDPNSKPSKPGGSPAQQSQTPAPATDAAKSTEPLTREKYQEVYDKHIKAGRAPFAAKMLADKETGMAPGVSAVTLPSSGSTTAVGTPASSSVAPTTLPETSTSGSLTREKYQEVYDKHIKAGRAPFAAKMLADKETGMAPGVSAVTLPTAQTVYQNSANVSSSAIPQPQSATTVVAPTTVNNTKNERISFKNNTRNTDSSYSSLIQSRFVPT